MEDDKLKFIRERCIAANPEIVETPPSNAVVAGLLGIIASNIRDTGQAHLAEMKLGELLEILGRRIRLADVYLAINNPHFSPIEFGWNLQADDLEKQSPETIDFLANLL